jgi:predicted nucleic acid-binding protein
VTLALLDTGPLTALFDSTEIAHAHYLALLSHPQQNWRLTTTWPCVVEASHFLPAPGRWQMLQWISEGGVSIFPFDPGHIPDIAALMRRYTQPRRAQMDFADATLVWAAGETGIRQIWTLDVRDFYRYRLPGGGAFDIL